jgi:hypothetical protein
MSSSATCNIIPHSKLHLVQTTIHRLKKKITKGETGKEYLYVFGNLLSQGYKKYKEIKWHNWLADVRRTALISHNFSIINYRWILSIETTTFYRLVAGVWTLAAFIFVQAYTSTLFTFAVIRCACGVMFHQGRDFSSQSLYDFT